MLRAMTSQLLEEERTEVAAAGRASRPTGSCAGSRET